MRLLPQRPHVRLLATAMVIVATTKMVMALSHLFMLPYHSKEISLCHYFSWRLPSPNHLPKCPRVPSSQPSPHLPHPAFRLLEPEGMIVEHESWSKVEGNKTIRIWSFFEYFQSHDISKSKNLLCVNVPVESKTRSTELTAGLKKEALLRYSELWSHYSDGSTDHLSKNDLKHASDSTSLCRLSSSTTVWQYPLTSSLIRVNILFKTLSA